MNSQQKTGTIKLHSWRDFTKVMKIMGAGKWIYRGHKSVTYHLDSGLDRYVKDIVAARNKRGIKTDKRTLALALPRAERSRAIRCGRAWQAMSSLSGRLMGAIRWSLR